MQDVPGAKLGLDLSGLLPRIVEIVTDDPHAPDADAIGDEAGAPVVRAQVVDEDLVLEP